MHKNFGKNDDFVPEIHKPRVFPMLHSHKVESKQEVIVELAYGEKDQSKTD